MWYRPVGFGHEVGKARAGVRHAEGGIQPLFRKILPRQPDHLGHRDRGGGEAEVGVGIPLAEAVLRLQIAQPAQDLGAVEPEILQQVPGVVEQTAAMREEVRHRHGLRRPGLV